MWINLINERYFQLASIFYWTEFGYIDYTIHIRAATAGKAPKAWALPAVFVFQYTHIRNNGPKNFGIEYWALPGSNSPWRPCILYCCYAEKPFDFGFEVQSCCNFPSRKVKIQKSKINLEQNWPYVWLGLHHRTTVEKPTLSSDSIHIGKFAREKSHKVPLICH